jgi:hypothetical protein
MSKSLTLNSTLQDTTMKAITDSQPHPFTSRHCCPLLDKVTDTTRQDQSAAVYQNQHGIGVHVELSFLPIQLLCMVLYTSKLSAFIDKSFAAQEILGHLGVPKTHHVLPMPPSQNFFGTHLWKSFAL